MLNFFSMRNYPRWSGLKHFNAVTSVRFTDAQQYVDILKVSFIIIHALSDSNTLAVYHSLHMLVVWQAGCPRIGDSCLPLVLHASARRIGRICPNWTLLGIRQPPPRIGQNAHIRRQMRVRIRHSSTTRVHSFDPPKDHPQSCVHCFAMVDCAGNFGIYCYYRTRNMSYIIESCNYFTANKLHPSGHCRACRCRRHWS
jgi:hypothetical protein